MLEEELEHGRGAAHADQLERGAVQQHHPRVQARPRVEDAAQDVRDKVARVRGRLPEDIEEPVVAKQDADAQPFYLARALGRELRPAAALRHRRPHGQDAGCRRSPAWASADLRRAALLDAGLALAVASSPPAASRCRTSRGHPDPQRRDPRRPHRVGPPRVHRALPGRAQDAGGVRRPGGQQRQRPAGQAQATSAGSSWAPEDERSRCRFKGTPADRPSASCGSPRPT